MKVVAYGIKSFEKEYLAIANQKKHDITLISNALTLETAAYAKGKEAVIIATSDFVSANIIDRLAAIRIKYIILIGPVQIDKKAADHYGIRVVNIPYQLSSMNADNNQPGLKKEELQKIADQTIKNLDLYDEPPAKLIA
jgi:lactate dehydrogenase-like 2-hydroxyacid dehydrogenase